MRWGLKGWCIDQSDHFWGEEWYRLAEGEVLISFLCSCRRMASHVPKDFSAWGIPLLMSASLSASSSHMSLRVLCLVYSLFCTFCYVPLMFLVITVPQPILSLCSDKQNKQEWLNLAPNSPEMEGRQARCLFLWTWDGLWLIGIMETEDRSFKLSLILPIKAFPH